MRFRSDVLDELGAHGIVPRTDTEPRLIREFLNDLYRYELRKLRDRVLVREMRRDRLALEVVELRKRYRLLSIPIAEWREPASR